jgi:hypothetical protein
MHRRLPLSETLMIAALIACTAVQLALMIHGLLAA